MKIKTFANVLDDYRKSCEAAAILGVFASSASDYSNEEFNHGLSGDEFTRTDVMFARDMKRLVALSESIRGKWLERSDKLASELEAIKFAYI